MWDPLLAAYLPMDRLQALATGRALREHSSGATLFADLAGFTPLAEDLARALGPRRGAEEVARQINAVYDALLPQVGAYGGSVIDFAGDAMVGYFDEDDGLRATACALAMQAAMGSFQALPLPTGKGLALGLKVGIARGPVRRFLVGNPTIQLLEALVGAPIVRMGAAEQQARRGEVLLDGDCARPLVHTLQVAEWRDAEEGRYARVTGLHETVPLAPWPELPLASLSEETLRPWLLPVVYERLRSGQGEFLTELRPVVALFLRFGGIDYEQDEQAGAKLDAFVRWVQQVAGEYEGTLLDLTLGDKGSYLYIALGAPLAHEHDTLRTLRVAQMLRNTSAFFPFLEPVQIGINRGTMRTGAYGGTTRRTYGVLGDEVNLAARLMQAAAPGQVLVSEPVQRAAGEHACWQPLPPLRIKGKYVSVPVFALESVPARSTLDLHRGGYHLPLIGRQIERAQIAERLALALSGQGQIVGITGEAGIGKSRLVAEGADLAEARGLVIYGGACQSYGPNSAYLVWQPIWRAFFGLPEEASPSDQVAHLADSLAQMAPSLLARLPLLAEAVGVEIPDNELTRTFDPALRKQSREALLVDCLKLRARQTPLLLVLEDSQWLDDLSYDLVAAMGRALWTLPVLLLLAYRPPQPGQRLASVGRGLPHFTELVLGELTAEEAEQLIRSRMRERVKNEEVLDALVRQVLSRTQGNPFYMEELLSYLLEHAERLNDVAALAEVRWPLSLESLILSRLDQLGEREQLTLKVASVIGRTFQGSWLWGYYPPLGTPEAVQTMLTALTQTTLLAQEQAEPERVYLFRQVLTQEVTYQSLAEATRALLHEQLAHFLEATSVPPPSLDLLAYHYARSANLTKKRELLWQAGEAAQRAYANAAACSYYEQLLPLLDTPEAQGDLRRRLGDIAELMGEYESAEMHYQVALALAEAAGDGLARLRSQWRLGQLLEKRGAYEAVLRWREQLHQQATLLPSITTAHAEWSQVRLITGRTLTRQGAYEVAWAELEEGLALARQGGNQDAVALALTYLGNVALYQGKYEAARGLYEESLRHRQALGDKRGIARVLNTLGNVMGVQEASAERALYEEALALQRELGDKWGMAASLTNLGVFAQAQGEYETAAEFYEESLLLWRELGEKGNIALLLNNMGSLASHQGAYAQARILHTEGLALACAIGERRQILYGLLGVAVVDTGAQAGNMVRGTRLASVVEQVLHQMGAVLEPLAENFMKQTISAARTALGEAAFVAAWAEGQVMTLEDAVGEILADATHSPPAR